MDSKEYTCYILLRTDHRLVRKLSFQVKCHISKYKTSKSWIDAAGSEICNQVRESILILPVEFCKNPWILPYNFVRSTAIFMRIHLDSCNCVDENLCENGFSDCRQISDPDAEKFSPKNRPPMSLVLLDEIYACAIMDLHNAYLQKFVNNWSG